MKKLKIITSIKSFLGMITIIFLCSLLVFAATPTLPQCDINGDGTINIVDLNRISERMGAKGLSGWIKEDVDKNGIIQVCDMMFIATHYGESVSPTTGGSNSGTTNDKGRIQKMSICYSGNIANSACRTYIAQHFDLVDTSFEHPTEVQWIKENAVNSNIKVLGYYDVVFDSSGLQDNWYVQTTSGTRVRSSDISSNYVLDPSSGWASYFIQRAQTALKSKTMYDGVFLDDLWYDPTYDNEYWSYSPSKWDISMTTWKSSMVTFIGNLKTSLGNDIVMANIVPQSAFGVIGEKSKAVLLEHFVHQLETSVTNNGRSATSILESIDYLHTQATKGHLIGVVSGCNAGTGYEDWAKFCYACFAFAVDDPSKAYFAWNFMGSSPTNNPTWFQWMDDYVLGSPTDNYHSISGNVYGRTFANYYVLANLNNLNTYTTFTFNNKSYTLEGKHALFIAK